MKKNIRTLLLTLSVLSLVSCGSPSYTDLSNQELLDECTTDMATQFHIHSHITIIADGQTLTIPADIGIDRVTNCMSSIHTHETDGVIHVESPVERDFTLGDFFYNWNETLTPQQVLDYKVDDTHGLKMYVDGEVSNLFTDLVLTDEQSIVLDYYELAKGPNPIPENYEFEE